MRKVILKTIPGKKLKLVEKLFKKRVISLKQTHENKILILKNEKAVQNHIDKYQNNRSFDGVITNLSQVYLTVKHADCAPVFLYSNDQEIIGLLHCGWKSVQKSIIENTLTKIAEFKNSFSKKISNLKVQIGPTICKNCYVIKTDLVKKFQKKMNEYDLEKKEIFFLKKENIHFDLKKLIELVFKKNQVTILKKSRICPKCHPDYFSYRENKTGERNFSYILKKDK